MTRLAKITGAAVVPFVTRQRPGGAGYAATFHPAWQDFPSDDVEADTRRMNAYIEAEVLKMPEQYLLAAQALQDAATRGKGGLLRRLFRFRAPPSPLTLSDVHQSLP